MPPGLLTHIILDHHLQTECPVPHADTDQHGQSQRIDRRADKRRRRGMVGVPRLAVSTTR